MRTRALLFTGMAVGYYMGTKAGRQRYDQINKMISKVRKSKAYDSAQDRAKAVADVAADRAKDVASTAKDTVNEKLHHTNGKGQPNTFSAS